MLNPKTCENCNNAGPVVFITYKVRGHEIKVALCDECSRLGPPDHILKAKASRLPPSERPKPKPRIFVVVEIQSRDDYYAFQPLKTPIAAFLNELNAAAFVDSRRRQELPYLDWEIVPAPLEDIGMGKSGRQR